MTADVELLPLVGTLAAMPPHHQEVVQSYARANVAHHVAPLKYALDNAARGIKTLREVRDRQAAEIEALRADVDSWKAQAMHNLKLVERLQDIVKPKREEECLTLDHWRMRAYDLEARWSRASRAANIEAEARKNAEAQAERLADALRECVDLIETITPIEGDTVRKARAALRDQEEGK